MKLPFGSANSSKDHSPTPAEHAAYLAYLERLKTGDSAAWEAFVAEWSPRLYPYVSANLRNVDDVEDVLHEILIGIVTGVQTFDGNAAMSTFVYRIAYHKVVDYWRRNKRVTVELSETISTEDSTLGMEIQEVLDKLPEDSCQVLLLRYYAGLTVSEVAKIMDRTYKATESLLSRARHQFQSAFAEYGEAAR